MLEALKTSAKEKYFIIISFIYILYVIFPLFGDYLNIPVFVPALLVVGYITIFYPGVYGQKSMLWFMIYIGMLFLYSFIGLPIHINGVNGELPYWWRITIEAAWTMPAIMIAGVLFHRNNSGLYKLFGLGSILFLVISFLYILPLIISSKGILREEIQNFDTIRPLGLPDYGLMHAYTLFLTPICYYLKYAKKTSKAKTILLLLLFFYVVVQTSVTTSLLVSAVIFSFTLLFSKKNKKGTIVLAFFFAFVLYLLYYLGFFLLIVDTLMPLFEGTAVSGKLQDMHDSLVSGTIQGETITGRMDFHQTSVDSFLKNPIFGGGLAGGHSKFLDILGCSGLFVFIPFIMFIWSSLKKQTSVCTSSMCRTFVVMSYVAAGLFLYEKGLFGASGFLSLLVIVPAALIAYDNKIQTANEK